MVVQLPSFVSDWVPYFRRYYVPLTDIDGVLNDASLPFWKALNAFVSTGLSVFPISIFHYAAINYANRWGDYNARWNNAFLSCGINQVIDIGGFLALEFAGDHELRRESSEVVAVGLSTYLMVNLLQVPVTRIRKIVKSGKRCDYEVLCDGYSVVYESRGRTGKYLSTAMRAVKDLGQKKAAHRARYIYGLVSLFKDRTQPIELFLFDPPSTNTEPPSRMDILRNLADHYRKVCLLAGLDELAAEISHRLFVYEETGRWIEGPLRGLRYIRPFYLNEELGYITNQIKGSSFERVPYDASQEKNKNSREVPPDHTKPVFALRSEVVEYLLAWDLESLAETRFEATVDPVRLISYADDGSVLHLMLPGE